MPTGKVAAFTDLSNPRKDGHVRKPADSDGRIAGRVVMTL